MRLLILLSRDEYVRNYVETDALRQLTQGHECRIGLSDHCVRMEAVRDVPGYAGVVRTDRAVEKSHYELFNILTWRHRQRSRTFRYRFSRLYRTYPYTSARNVLRNLSGLRQAAAYVLLGNRLVGRFSIPRLIERLPVNADLVRLLREHRPDLVLFPCSAYDPLGNDLARLAPELGFRTLFLVDNWDNLSSKSIFWAVPDYLGVWGAQSREHAREIHGIDPERVFLLGTPRFEKYYAVRARKPVSPYPFPYILFCGSALAFDELGALRVVDQELAAHPERYPGLKVVYRPHPQRQPRLSPDLFREADFQHVVLDRQMEEAYYRRDVGFHPALAYYPSLLAGAELVVCPLTTMLVEALLCGTPVLALAYDDGIHYTSPNQAYRFYRHFEGIEQIRGLSLTHHRSSLAADLRALVESPPVFTGEEIDTSLRPFLFSDGRSYGTRLAAAVDAIARTGRSPAHLPPRD